jgi:CubicO group peptidase (beta-lactamase class C family)
MASKFEAEVGRMMMQFNTPGVAVEMRAGGKRYGAHMGRLSQGGHHPLTQKTRFPTVCLIKLLIAIDLLILSEKAQISLDDSIADHLPELGNGPTAKGKFLKIRHLLSHTGGFRSLMLEQLLQLAQESWQSCVNLLHDTPQLFEPGMVFEDDHLSHIILGELLSRLRGKPVMDVVAEDVLAPLGIRPGYRDRDVEQPEIYSSRHEWVRTEKRWQAEPDVYAAPSPSSCSISPLSMTSANLMRLGEALLDGPAAGQTIITPWVREKLFSEVVRVPREISPVRVTRWHLAAFGMGMATFRGGHRGFITTGRGQNTSIVFDNGRRSVLTTSMNSTNILEREALLNALFAKFAGDSSIVPEPQTIDIGFDEFLQPFTTRDIAGVYVGFTPDPVEIFATARSFVVRIGKEDRYQFEASPQNRLVIRARMPVPIGVFQVPASLRPCLTMGMHPYKKVG